MKKILVICLMLISCTPVVKGRQIDPEKLENAMQGIAKDIVLLSQLHNETVEHVEKLEKRNGIKSSAITKITLPTPTATPVTK